MILLSKYM